MIQKLKKSNAGFTLVELIVVIAILGVLAAVLVPQYIQYVEKSREAVDKSTINEIVHAVQITAASQETFTAGTFTISVDTDGDVTYGTTSSVTAGEIAVICPIASSAMKSTDGKALGDLVVDVNATSVALQSASATKVNALAS